MFAALVVLGVSAAAYQKDGMAGCSGLLGPFLISLFLAITAKEQGAKQKEVLHSNAKAFFHHRTDTPTAIFAPTDVQVVATCDHFIHASWKHKNNKVHGFVVTLTEEVGNIQEKLTLPATERHVIFKIDPYRRNFTFSIRSFLYGQGRRYWSEEVEKTVTSFGQAPDVEDFQAHAITATSARTTWKTKHSEDIHISVCLATHPEEDCVEYTTDGDLLVYVIDGLKPATRYIVHASFSLALNRTVCKYDTSSQTITTPARAPPSLKARTISVSESTATVVVEPLSEHEFVRVTVDGEVRIYHSRMLTLRGLDPGRKYLLQMAACVDDETCNAQTELEVITADAPSRPRIKIVQESNSSITIRWAFPEASNESVNYQVGYSGARQSFFDFTTDNSYEFTDLEPNSTYTIYVEAFKMEEDSVNIGSASFVIASTDAEKPLLSSESPTFEISKQPMRTAFSTNDGGSQTKTGSSVTPSTRLDTVRQRSSGRCRYPLPVLSVLSVLTALLGCLRISEM